MNTGLLPYEDQPHYHAAVFNYWPTDAKFYKQNHVGDLLYTSQELNEIWKNGYVIVGRLTFESAAYIARYVYKKAYGIDKNFNLKRGKQPEFTLTSRKGGIGINGIEDKEQFEKIKRNFCILIPTKTGVKRFSIPQFLRNKWRTLKDRQEYFKLAEQNTHANKNVTRAQLEKTDKNYFYYQKTLREIQANKLKRLDKRTDL